MSGPSSLLKVALQLVLWIRCTNSRAAVVFFSTWTTSKFYRSKFTNFIVRPKIHISTTNIYTVSKWMILTMFLRDKTACARSLLIHQVNRMTSAEMKTYHLCCTTYGIKKIYWRKCINQLTSKVMIKDGVQLMPIIKNTWKQKKYILYIICVNILHIICVNEVELVVIKLLCNIFLKITVVSFKVIPLQAICQWQVQVQKKKMIMKASPCVIGAEDLSDHLHRRVQSNPFGRYILMSGPNSLLKAALQLVLWICGFIRQIPELPWYYFQH